MAYKNFKFDVDADGIALVTWDIPGRSMNVFDEVSTQEIGEIIKQTTSDPAIKGVVITSAKEAFCAGADLSMLEGMNRSYAQLFKEKGEEAANQMLFEQSRRMSQSFRAIETSGKPWVAAINGLALGGGFELAMSCHHRVALSSAKVGLPEVKLGLLPGAGGTQRLPRAVSKAKAMDLCLTARMMGAEEAERAGLVSRVISADKLLDEAIQAAETIAGFSLPAVMMIKESINAAYETSLAEGVHLERRLFHATFATEDQKEGMRAFLEKRPPAFKHQ